MTQTTWDMVRTVLERANGLKHERGDQWRGSSPYRLGSDGNTFVVRIAADGEHGSYYDHKDNSGGSLYELAAHLGIAPARLFSPVQPTKRSYHGLKDYAEAHGVPEQAYIDWYWQAAPVVVKGRAAIVFQTQGGKRWRFIDGQKPAFISEPGYKQCWYGMAGAAKMALEKGTPLIFCNGEPSVVAAQHWGLPATTITSGEKATFPAALLQQIKSVYNGKIVIAMDCDFTGTNAAFGLVKAFAAVGIDATAIDLGLGDGGDLGDFCKLYQTDSLTRFQECKPLEARALPPEQLALPSVSQASALLNVEDLYCSDIDALQAYMDELVGDTPPKSPPLPNPYKFLHSQGGFGEIIPKGKLVYFASVSAGTKTIGFETGWEAYQNMGIHSIVYTPEWVDGDSNAIELGARAVQRSGGAYFGDWLKHRVYQSEQAFNMKTASGKALLPNEVSSSYNHASNLMRRPGRVFFIKKPNLSVEQLCAAVDAICEREARNGIVIQAVWVDFAQLLWLQTAGDTGRIWIETAMGLIKATCRSSNLVGFVNTQMRKDDAELAKTGGKLDAGMMQFLSEQQANFVFAFVPKYEDGKRCTMVDKDNPHYEIGVLRGKVLKNSLAPVKDDEIEIPVNFSRLMWLQGGR